MTLPGFDDRLTAELERAARPGDPTGVLERVSRKRSRRASLRKVQAGLLAFAVLTATAGGFLFLRDAFDTDKRNVGDEQPPAVANGEIVFSRGLPDGSEHVFAVQPGVVGERLITSGSAIYADPSVAPDGRAIAVVHSLPRFAEMNAEGVIATFTMDGGEPTWITDPLPRVGDPSWSPEGDRIAFAGAAKAGLPGIYVMEGDGSDVRLVVKLDGVTLSAPDWSPDGKSLVFVALAVSESEADLMEPDIYRVGLDGTGLTNLTQTPAVGEWSPSWSPTGSGIAFHRNDPTKRNRIQIMDIQGRHIQTVFDESGSIEIGELDWSPDGERIAFTSSLALTDTDDEGDLDVWTVRVDGTQLTNLTTDGASGLSWQPLPVGSEPQPSPTSEPTVSPSPEPAGRDIGLGFNLCQLEQLGGIDWYGDGKRGTAWTGRRLSDTGQCPMSDDTSLDDDSTLVVADLDGDGLADTWAPLDLCISCQPWAAIDLDSNGAAELVVLIQAGTTPQYGFYHAVPDGLPRSSGIYPVFIEGPGAPAAGFPADRMVTVWAGGDEGDSFAIRCEGYPEDPVLVAAQLHAPVDTDIRDIHITRLKLETLAQLENAHFVVLDSTSPTEAGEDWGGDAKACGVDFNPWA